MDVLYPGYYTRTIWHALLFEAPIEYIKIRKNLPEMPNMVLTSSRCSSSPDPENHHSASQRAYISKIFPWVAPNRPEIMRAILFPASEIHAQITPCFYSWVRRPKFQMLVTPKPLHLFGRDLVFRGILGCLFQIQSQILLLKTFKISL